MPETAAPPRDPVEALLEAHVRLRHMVALAESLEVCSATESTVEVARRVEDFFRGELLRHVADEEHSLAPRLRGRHDVVDRALLTAQMDHFREAALGARVAGLCTQVRADVNALHGLRFALGQAVVELKGLVRRHHELEESIIFPALKRLLPPEAVQDIAREMAERAKTHRPS